MSAPAPVGPNEYDLATKAIPVLLNVQPMPIGPEIEQAAEDLLGPNWFLWILMGIASRESRFGLLLDQNGLGDNGHGYGVFQIDDCAHPAFCASSKPRDLYQSAVYAAGVLEWCYSVLRKQPELFESPEAMLRGTIAAYNCGPGKSYGTKGVLGALYMNQDLDYNTTGRDYSSDVLNRAAWFKETCHGLVG